MNTKKHQKQIIGQVYLPMIFIVLVLAVSSFFLFGKLSDGEMDYRIWSDISILVITLPFILSFLFIFLLFSIVIYLISRLKVKFKKASLNLNSISAPIFHWIINLSRLITQPVIHLESFITQLSLTKKEKQE
ncbi:MAG: hypothetical protein Q8N39_09015 [Pelolinea sp.]|nr:hypothetical protein [Pelolinea sp.]